MLRKGRKILPSLVCVATVTTKSFDRKYFNEQRIFDIIARTNGVSYEWQMDQKSAGVAGLAQQKQQKKCIKVIAGPLLA